MNAWQRRFREWWGPASMATLIVAGLTLAVITLLVWRTPTGVIGSETDTWTGHSVAAAASLPAVSSPSPKVRATSTPAPAIENITTTSKKDTFQQSLPSDAVIATLLAISALLFLAGIFLPRIVPSRFPGAVAEADPEVIPVTGQSTPTMSAQTQSRLQRTRRVRSLRDEYSDGA